MAARAAKATTNPTTSAADLSLAEAVCLCLVASGVQHGYAIQKACDPDGPVGSVWQLNSQLVYRAVDGLVAAGLVGKAGFEQGSGPARTVLSVTRRGAKVARQWVHLPVEHLRDVRSHLLLKLVLGERLGEDLPTLIASQHDALRPVIEARLATAPRSVAELWRQETARSVDRFLTEAAAAGLPATRVR